MDDDQDSILSALMMGNSANNDRIIPPIMQHTIKLDGLSPDEERIIKEVLARDAKVSETLDGRISSVRKEIQNIRKQGALTEQDDLNTMCARCKQKFWAVPLPFTDRGLRCIRCKFRVCKRCRVRQVNKTWLCSLCLKLRQVKLLTGEWMGTGESNDGLYGSDLIRASFRDRGVTEEERTEIRCPTPQYVVTKAVMHKGAESGSRTSVSSRSSEGTITGPDDFYPSQIKQQPARNSQVSEANGEIVATSEDDVKGESDASLTSGGVIHVGNAHNNANFTRVSDYGRITIRTPRRPSVAKQNIRRQSEATVGGLRRQQSTESPDWMGTKIPKKKKKKKRSKKKRKKRGRGKKKKRPKSSKRKRRKHHKHKRSRSAKKGKHHHHRRKNKKKRKQRNANATVNNVVSEMSLEQSGNHLVRTLRSRRRSPRRRSWDVEAAGVNTSFSNRRCFRDTKTMALKISSRSSISTAKRDLKSVPNCGHHRHYLPAAENFETSKRDSLKSLTSLKHQDCPNSEIQTRPHETRLHCKQASPVVSSAHINLFSRSRSERHVPTFILKGPPYHELNINRSHPKIKNTRNSNEVESFSGEQHLACNFSCTADIEEKGTRENPPGNTSTRKVDPEIRVRKKQRSRRSLYRVLFDSFLSKKNETYKELSLPKSDNALHKGNAASISRNTHGENQIMRFSPTQKSQNEKQNVPVNNLETQRTKNVPIGMALDQCDSRPTISSYDIFEAADCSSVHDVSKGRRKNSSRGRRETLPREKLDNSCNWRDNASRDAKLQGDKVDQKSPDVQKSYAFVAAPPAEESAPHDSYLKSSPEGAEVPRVHQERSWHESDVNVNFQPTGRPTKAKESKGTLHPKQKKSIVRNKSSHLDANVLSRESSIHTLKAPSSSGGTPGRPLASLADVLEDAYKAQSQFQLVPPSSKSSKSTLNVPDIPASRPGDDVAPMLPNRNQRKSPGRFLSRLSPFHRHHHRSHGASAGATNTSSSTGQFLTPSSSSSSIVSLFKRRRRGSRSPSPSSSSHSSDRIDQSSSGRLTPLHWDADVSEDPDSVFVSTALGTPKIPSQPLRSRDWIGDRAQHYDSRDDRARGRMWRKAHDCKSDLEAFRSRAGRKLSPPTFGKLPTKSKTSFTFYDIVQQAVEADRKTKAMRSLWKKKGIKSEMTDDQGNVLHWHETLRRRSVDEEMLKLRRRSLLDPQQLDKRPGSINPLLLSSYDTACTLQIPHRSPVSNRGQLSPPLSIASTSSEDSISRYVQEFHSTKSGNARANKSAYQRASTGSPEFLHVDGVDSRSHVHHNSASSDYRIWRSPKTSTPRHRSRGPYRRRRQPKVSAHATREAAAPTSYSSPGRHKAPRGSKPDSSSSSQRRDSYSKALENQKVKVILPLGNDGSLASGPDGDSPDSASVHDAVQDSGHDWDGDSLSSSSRSFSSSQPPSRNSSFNSSRSSRHSNKRMLRTDHGDGEWKDNQSTGSGSVFPSHKVSKDKSSAAKLGDTKGMSSNNSPSLKRRGDVEERYEHGQQGSRSPSTSSVGLHREDSFEKIYDSNVNRLVEMMTGSAMPEAKEKRLLPRTPDTGKSRKYWMEKNVSLSEEYADNLKYVSVDEIGDDLNDDSFIGVEGEGHAPNSKSSKPDSLSKGSGMVIATGSARRLPDLDTANQKSPNTTVGKGQGNEFTDEDTGSKQSRVLPRNGHPHSGSPTSAKGDVNKSDVVTRKQKTGSGNQQSLQQQSASLAHLRIPAREIPDEFKTSLCRHSSNASDTLSIITEISDSFGEAESIGNGNSSDDTLHEANFNESLSDDEVHIGNTVKAGFSSVEQGPNSQHKSNSDTSLTGDHDLPLTRSYNISEPDLDKKSDEALEKYSNENPGNKQNRDGFKSSARGIRKKSIDDTTISCTSDDSGFIENKGNKDQVETRITKGNSCNNSSNPYHDDDAGGGDVVIHKKERNHIDSDSESESSSSCVDVGSTQVTLLSMALEQQKQTPVQHPPLRQLKVFRMLSESMSESSVDLDIEYEEAARRGTGHRRERVDFYDADRDRYGPDGERRRRTPLSTSSASSESQLGSYDAESLRDSDSGVTSSGHASQVTTPEQRSLSNEKGDSHPNYAATDKSSVPIIAVTEETGEEEDDLDELFSKHRNDSSILGSRSSLRDSRESLYSVYSNAEENYGNVPVTGEILFHLTYDYKSNVLAVHIKQCKEISPVDTKHNRSDPYVKTYLLPDKTRGSKRKTKIKRHTLNPVFDEVLKYSLSTAELDSRTLWVSVWNNDRFGRNDFLGEVTIPLAYYKYDNSAPIWYLLQERAAPEDTSLMTYKGDLYISLKYVPANMVDSKKKVTGSRKSKSKSRMDTSGLGEVHVLVKEAKNLTAMRGSAGSNPFCKGYFLPDKSHNSKQKTPVIKKSTNPEWQHILVFEGVDENQLEQHGLELTIWDYEKLASNDFLGGVRLNLGLGTSQGKPVDWMDAKGEEIEIWQAMMETPNEWVDAQLPLRSSMGVQNIKK